MLDWFSTFLEELNWAEVLLGIGLFVVMFALSLAEVTFILVKLPERYFAPGYHVYERNHHVTLRGVLLVIGKNLLGLAHIAVGVVLSIPGVPGQGILTILIGVMLMDLPGVRRLERNLVRRPKVYASINQIRARFGKPPLVLDGPGDLGDLGDQPAAQEKPEASPPVVASSRTSERR